MIRGFQGQPRTGHNGFLRVPASSVRSPRRLLSPAASYLALHPRQGRKP